MAPTNRRGRVPHYLRHLDAPGGGREARKRWRLLWTLYAQEVAREAASLPPLTDAVDPAEVW